MTVVHAESAESAVETESVCANTNSHWMCGRLSECVKVRHYRVQVREYTNSLQLEIFNLCLFFDILCYQEELRLEAERENRRLDVETQQKQLSDKQEQLAKQMQELEAEEEGNKQKAKDEAAQKLKDMINHANQETEDNAEENDYALLSEAEILPDEEVSEGVFPSDEINASSDSSKNPEITHSEHSNPEILTADLSNDNNLFKV